MPLICKESSHGNAVVAATKRMEEMDRLRGTTTNGEDRIKMAKELEVLKAILDTMNKDDKSS